jgi:predicted TIM-barrel fold metal-dependent hydrolase
MARLRHPGPYNDWVRDTRLPDPAPPEGSIDCQFHIYDDPARFPARKDAPYPPLDATFAHAREMHAKLGFRHGVIVHSAIYGSDHSMLLHVLKNQPIPGQYKGTANLADDTSDAEIAELTKAGVNAARINFVKYLTMTPGKKSVTYVFDRLKEIGWHARLHVVAEDLLEHADLLKSIKDVPMLIEHLGHVEYEGGLDQPACRFIIDMLKHENWWMMASNGNRDSAMDAGWDDAVPFGAAFIAAAPDRTVWGTDWPHPMWHKPMMNDADEVDLLYRYVDYDADMIRRVLVDNPRRLYGFV